MTTPTKEKLMLGIQCPGDVERLAQLLADALAEVERLRAEYNDLRYRTETAQISAMDWELRFKAQLAELEQLREGGKRHYNVNEGLLEEISRLRAAIDAARKKEV